MSLYYYRLTNNTIEVIEQIVLVLVQFSIVDRISYEYISSFI
jgi:hypothetical protein